MAFNKVFITILALAACAMAMPVHQDDQTTQSVGVESTSASIDVEDSSAVQESVTTSATTDKDEASNTESSVKTEVEEEAVDQEVAKRSIEEESDGDDDLETAAGTNVLRPLFVYRQQVAYRQRIRNANRRGNRRF